MRHCLIAAAMTFAALSPALALDDGGIPAKPGDIEFDVAAPRRPTVAENRKILPNRIPVYVAHEDSRTFAVDVFVRPRSIHDLTALLHVAGSAALFGRVGQRTGAWQSLLASIGARISTRCANGLVVISVTGPAAKAGEAVRALVAAIESPALDDSSLSSTAAARMLGFGADLAYDASGTLSIAASGPMPALPPAAARAAELASMLRSDLMICVAVHGGGADTAFETLVSTMGAWARNPPPDPGKTTAPGAGEIRILDSDSSSAFCEIGFLAPDTGAGVPDSSFLVTFRILGSRLLARIRRSSPVPNPVEILTDIDQSGRGAVGFRFLLPTVLAAQAVGVVLDEAAALSAAYPSRDEVFVAQEALRAEHAARFANRRTGAAFFAAAECSRGEPLPESYVRDPVIGVGADMVRQSAVEWMQPARFFCRIVGRASDLEKRLAEFKASAYGAKVVRVK